MATSSSLSPAEARVPLVEERADALAPVFGGLQQHVEVLLQPDALRERQVKRPDDGFLGETEREGPAGGERTRGLAHRSGEAPRRHDGGDEAPLRRARRAEPRAEEDEVERAG